MPINASYNFVPLASTVVTPDWADLVSHDLPFQDGLCGEINFTLTAHSAILVGGEQNRLENQPGTVLPFVLPDGRYAIPGSSQKGAIRSVLEIATFSRMSMVDDNRWSVRDLTSSARSFYGNIMSKNLGYDRYAARTNAGWLMLKNGAWHITPCNYSRVEHDDLALFTKNKWWNAVPRCSAKDKYSYWGTRSLNLKFMPGDKTLHPHSQGRQLEYSKAESLGTGPVEGTLVFTGQPAPRPPSHPPGKKHLEFMFYDAALNTLEIPGEVIRAFLHIHRKRDGYKGEEWEFWQRKDRIPVFYLTDAKGDVESLGLALMYKLAYKHSIHSTIKHTGNGVHLLPGKPDFATVLFGSVGDKPTDCYKGRVWFETAMPIGDTVRAATPSTLVLNAPKPTYYPNYVRQPTQDGQHLKGDTYKTYMEENAEIRGWKRYPVRPDITESAPGTDSISTTLHLLQAGAQFKGRVVFHNLKPVELGAVLWAMTWGGEANLRHAFGIGKSLGYGQVSLNIDNSNIAHNLEPATVIDVNSLLRTFVAYMQSQVPDWLKSEQIQAICGMANPAKAKLFQGKLQHMLLEPDNQFIHAKKERLILAEYPRHICTAPTAAAAPPAAPETWTGVKLKFTPNNGVISTVGAKRAASVAGDKDKLLSGLSKKQLGLLQKGDITATITVGPSGNGWKILDIAW